MMKFKEIYDIRKLWLLILIITFCLNSLVQSADDKEKNKKELKKEEISAKEKKIRAEIKDINIEIDRLKAIHNLNIEKEKSKLSDLENETNRINKKLSLEEAKLLEKKLNIKIKKADIENKIELLELENKLKIAKIEQEKLIIDKELELENRKLDKKLAKGKLAKQEIDHQLSMKELENKKNNKDIELEKANLDLKLALEKSKFSLESEESRQKYEKNKNVKLLADSEYNARLAQLNSKNIDKIAELRAKVMILEAENSMLTSEVKKSGNDLKLSDNKWRSKIQNLRQEINYKDIVHEADMYTKRDKVEYHQDPLIDGALVISDRRIPLNGLITMRTADYITERIHFYNNKNSEYPIFIVIDYSPGGSVMSGFRILKAMENSDAPVYVVVKSLAASMAAGITTNAERSFAYPNALILHHQMSYGSYGNITDHADQTKFSHKTWLRLIATISKKMNITSDEFIKRMYENNARGDWIVYADEAKKLKWLTNVVEEIRESKYLKNPDFVRPASFLLQANDSGISKKDSTEKIDKNGRIYLKEQIDDSGNPFTFLPRPRPFDFYYLYNPDNYFRVR